jgi:asparagine synthase (glutamine-hydrolysing)
MEQDYVLNKVLHFDFKCLLPALLHVEDRVSMAHGLESRVPFLDHRVVEFAANLSPNIKFIDGEMKSFIKNTFKDTIPDVILNRTDKMGFPVPLNNWANSHLKDFIYDTMIGVSGNKVRSFINYGQLLNNFNDGIYSRKLWGMLSFELWLQEFYDKHHSYKKLLQVPAMQIKVV